MDDKKSWLIFINIYANFVFSSIFVSTSKTNRCLLDEIDINFAISLL